VAPNALSGTGVDLQPDAQVRQAGEVRSSRVESLRALAALGVLVEHSYGYAHGFSATAIFSTFGDRLLASTGNGVYLFFSLSGYLLFLPFARHYYLGSSKPSVGKYASNRAVRILPLYYVVIITYLLLGSATLSQWVHYLTFTQNFSNGSLLRIDPPTWSIVAEVEFYAALPLFAWALGRLSQGSLRRGALLLGAVTAIAVLIRFGFVGTHASTMAIYSPFTNTMFFAPGMFLALAKCARPERFVARLPGVLRRAEVWLLVGVGLWVAHAWLFSYDELVALASLAVLGACVLPFEGGFALEVLEWRALALLGTASYSLYLWHDGVTKALATVVPGGFVGLLVVVVPVCCAIAFASYAIIERPFLRLRKAWTSTSSSARTTPGLAPAANS